MTWNIVIIHKAGSFKHLREKQHTEHTPYLMQLEKTDKKKTLERGKKPWLPWVIGLGLIGLIPLILLIGGLVKGGVVTLFSTQTPTLTFTPTLTSTPISTSTPTLTPAPTSTSTPEFLVTLIFAATQELGIGSTLIRPVDGMIMMYVPAGSFTMGSNNYSDQGPIHAVTLDAFWIDQSEVTNGMYAKCVATGKCTPPASSSSESQSIYYGNSQFENFPVIHVSWKAAADYCTWASARLPSEAEWEKAARGGLEGMDYPWGNEDPTCMIGAANGAQFGSCGFKADIPMGSSIPFGSVGVSDTTTVASFGKNGYGLYDMAGNVWEWVNDWYDSIYYSQSPTNNPTGPVSGTYRVLRGGSWFNYGDNRRTAFRGGGTPNYTNYDLGFRCSISLP